MINRAFPCRVGQGGRSLGRGGQGGRGHGGAAAAHPRLPVAPAAAARAGRPGGSRAARRRGAPRQRGGFRPGLEILPEPLVSSIDPKVGSEDGNTKPARGGLLEDGFQAGLPGLEAGAVHGCDVHPVGDGVGALDGAPGVALRRAEALLLGGVPADRGRVEEDGRPAQRGEPRALLRMGQVVRQLVAGIVAVANRQGCIRKTSSSDPQYQ